MKVLSWNVNSIRVRKDQLFSVIKKENPDIICLQETKTNDDSFPKDVLEKNGYFVFPPDDSYKTINLSMDGNVVTVNNYFECLNYASGGFIPLSSEQFFKNTDIEKPIFFIFVLLLSCISIISTEIILWKDEQL